MGDAEGDVVGLFSDEELAEEDAAPAPEAGGDLVPAEDPQRQLEADKREADFAVGLQGKLHEMVEPWHVLVFFQYLQYEALLPVLFMQNWSPTRHLDGPASTAATSFAGLGTWQKYGAFFVGSFMQ